MAIERVDDSAEDRRTLTLTNGDVVDLAFADDRVIAYVNQEVVGEFAFLLYETPIGVEGDETVARLTHAFLEGHNGRYKGQGIGTAAVRFFLDSTGYQLELPEDDGITKSDGSHLVEDGPAFIQSLRDKLSKGKL